MVVPIEEKVHPIKRLDFRESLKIIVLELEVGKSTVNDWKTNSAKIEKWCFCHARESGIQ